jgi:CheY-like chemotaxis protein
MEVFTAENRTAALDAVCRIAPDVIVTNIHMPWLELFR